MTLLAGVSQLVTETRQGRGFLGGMIGFDEAELVAGMSMEIGAID